MTLDGATGGKVHRLVEPPFLYFAASATVISAIVAFAVWWTRIAWLTAIIPVVPAVVAAVMSVTLKKEPMLKELFRTLLDHRVAARWWGISLLLFPAISILALGIFAVTGDTTIEFGMPRFLAFAVALPLALCNELGWRGFATRFLSKRRGAFAQSVIVGIAWVISVLPFSFAKVSFFSGVSAYELALLLLPLSTLLFWLYANTKSLLMPSFFLASGVMMTTLLPILPGDSSSGLTFWLAVGLLWVAGIIVVGYYGTDGLDHSINVLAPDELPVDWDKIMPRAKLDRKQVTKGRPRSKGFSSVGKRPRR